MIDRRRACLVALAALPLSALFLSQPASAEQAFQRFFPFFIEIDGWEGKKPDGLSMDMPGNSMITATREYRRGPAQFTAQIIIGPVAKGVLATVGQGLNVETPDGRIKSSTIDGRKVMQTFTIKDKSGAVMVALDDSRVFSLSFKGVEGDEAMALAQKFDWKAITAAPTN
jgi:hypothetical protein